jgi:hypothetical protein
MTSKKTKALCLKLFKADLKHLIYFAESTSTETSKDKLYKNVEHIKDELKRMDRFLEYKE